MAKAPVPGRVKTRLTPPLAADAAAALSAAFLRDITENIALAAGSGSLRGYVAFAPRGAESLFDGVLAHGTSLILADGETVRAPGVYGFGRCLLHAAQLLFAQGHQAVCLLNSDSPNLPTSRLREMADAMAEPGDRVVLGPADDGGYYVLGAKAPHRHLFENVAWSTGEVALQTRERARSLGLPVVELEPWYDVDDEAGLRRLCLDLGSGPSEAYSAAATAACIERLRIRDLLSSSNVENAN